jgi:hypothetical protein
MESILVPATPRLALENGIMDLVIVAASLDGSWKIKESLMEVISLPHHL